MEKKLLEKAQDYLNGDLSELESAISEKAKELNISEAKLAAALLKAAQSSQSERKEERTSHHEKMIFKKIDNTQRFFINIGEVDGVDEKGLIHFLIKYTPDLTEDDFADVYIKNTFSFFEVKDSFKDAIMENVNNVKYSKREVHVELSEKKTDATKKGPGAYKKHYDSVRKNDRHYDNHSTRNGSSHSGYAGRGFHHDEHSSRGARRINSKKKDRN